MCIRDRSWAILRSRMRSAPAVAAASAALLRIALPLSAASTAACSASRRGGVRVGVYIAIVVRTERHSHSMYNYKRWQVHSRFLVGLRPAASHYPHTTITEAYRFFLDPFFLDLADFFFFLVPPPEDDTLIRFGTLPLFARTLAARAAAASSSL